MKIRLGGVFAAMAVVVFTAGIGCRGTEEGALGVAEEACSVNYCVTTVDPCHCKEQTEIPRATLHERTRFYVTGADLPPTLAFWID